MTTRHNFGFLLLDRVSQELDGDPAWTKEESQTVAGLGKWEKFASPTSTVHLLWPLTFMNLSGQAVEKLLEFLPEDELCRKRDILVVIDDLSLPLGRVRIRKKGSAGGHNGLKSLESHLGHKEYSRLKLGIGHPQGNSTVVDYVLESFTEQEKPIVEDVLNHSTPDVLRWLAGSEVGDLSQSLNSWLAPALVNEATEEARERCQTAE